LSSKPGFIRNLFLAIGSLAMLAGISAAKTTKPVRKSAKQVRSSSHGKARTKTARHNSSRGRNARLKKASWRTRAQKNIDPNRARSIQEALIRENYLQGEPTGVWDQSTKDAMARYQEEHGWQTKMVPDSRALIQLGLGPSTDNLINPESAMTTRPQPAADRDNPSDLSGLQQ
jgi:hypothetical protein